MEGWKNRPKCFKFLECQSPSLIFFYYQKLELTSQSVCHTPQKCVFVRVVDTCAGCAPGSKHVDLTRAAFGQLANLDVGILTVQLRLATEPDRW